MAGNPSTCFRFAPIVITALLGACAAFSCGGGDDASSPPSDTPDASEENAAGKGGSGGSSVPDAGLGGTGGGAAGKGGGTGGATGGTGGTGGKGGSGGTGGTGGKDAGAKDTGVPEAAPPPAKTGYVVLSTMSDSVDGLHATWVRGAFFSGVAPTPAACTTEAVGSCKVTDCPEDLPTLSTTIGAGTLSFSGGSFALPNVTAGTDGKYKLDDSTPTTYWFMTSIPISVSATGTPFPAFQISGPSPTFVNNGKSPIDVSPAGSWIHLHNGVDATFQWLNGAAGDTFVVEFYAGHTWDFRNVPLPVVVRFECPSELGTGVLPASWIAKLDGPNNAFLSFTERRATTEVAPGASVTTVLRLGAIHSPLGEVTVDNCTPDCAGKQCGDDGCQGSCGTCGSGYSCSAGSCIPTCTPSCAGKECGSDGCTGTCGSCGSGATCTNGTCVSNVCDPVLDTGCTGADGCWVLSSELTTCAPPGTGTQGSSCASTSNCAGGYGCFANVCRKICRKSTGDGCEPGGVCNGVSGWVIYGACQ